MDDGIDQRAVSGAVAAKDPLFKENSKTSHQDTQEKRIVMPEGVVSIDAPCREPNATRKGKSSARASNGKLELEFCKLPFLLQYLLSPALI